MPALISSAVTYLLGKFSKTAVFTTLTISLKVAKWAIVLSFYLSIAFIFSFTYDLISDILAIFNGSTSSSGSSCVYQNFVYALTSLGVYDAVNSTLPAVVTSFTFLVSVFLYSITVKMKEKLENDVKTVLNSIYL